MAKNCVLLRNPQGLLLPIILNISVYLCSSMAKKPCYPAYSAHLSSVFYKNIRVYLCSSVANIKIRDNPSNPCSSVYKFSFLHFPYHRVSKLGTLQQPRPLHQSVKIIRHRPGRDRPFHTLDDQVRRLAPTHVAQHHLA